MFKFIKQVLADYVQFERALLKLKCLKIKNKLNLRKLIECYYPIYQDNFRIYLDEYQSNEPEIETDNFFYQRFLRRK